MTSAIAKPWLPSGALEPELLALPLGSIVKDWGHHWLANCETSVAPLYQDDWPQSDSTAWRSLEGISIALTTACRCAVASAILGRSILPNALQPNDRRLVDRLAQECADDLVRRVARSVSAGESSDRVRALPMDPADCSWWQVSVSGSRPLFRFVISHQAAVALAKSRLPPPRAKAMGGLRAGLAGQQVSVSVDLGHCPMNLAELDSLAVGDVLVMDQSTEESLHVLLNGSRSALLGRIGSTEGQASLIIAKEHRNG